MKGADFMNLTTLWHAVDDRLNQLDFAALADGFRRYRFALYTEREACLDGALTPRPDGISSPANSPR